MKITKDNVGKAIAALRQWAKENEGKATDTGAIRVSDLCNDVADYMERRSNIWREWNCPYGPAAHAKILLLDVTGEVTLCEGGLYNLMPGDKWAYVEDLLNV